MQKGLWGYCPEAGGVNGQSIIDQPSLTPLSVPCCCRLQLEVHHWANSVALDCGAGVFGLIRCISLSPSLALPTSFNNNKKNPTEAVDN